MKEIELDGKLIRFGEKNFMNARKDDCLWSACPIGESMQEARYGCASIRCCENEACMKWAADFAVKCDAIFRVPSA